MKSRETFSTNVKASGELVSKQQPPSTPTTHRSRWTTVLCLLVWSMLGGCATWRHVEGIKSRPAMFCRLSHLSTISRNCTLLIRCDGRRPSIILHADVVCVLNVYAFMQKVTKVCGSEIQLISTKNITMKPVIYDH